MDRDENQTDPWTSVVPFNFPDFFLVFYHFYIHYYSYICVNLFFQLFFSYEYFTILYNTMNFF